MRKNLTALTFLLAGALASGCVGSPSDQATANGLFELPRDVELLGSIEAEHWEAVPAGCEDRLENTVTFEVALDANGLLVAVDDEGEPVCTDTLEAIQAELEDEGREEEADDLEAAFALTIGAAPEQHEQVDFDPASDDPSPQPSDPSHSMQEEMPGQGDDPAEPGDPSPQPS